MEWCAAAQLQASGQPTRTPRVQPKSLKSSCACGMQTRSMGDAMRGSEATQALYKTLGYPDATSSVLGTRDTSPANTCNVQLSWQREKARKPRTKYRKAACAHTAALKMIACEVWRTQRKDIRHCGAILRSLMLCALGASPPGSLHNSSPANVRPRPGRDLKAAQKRRSSKGHRELRGATRPEIEV